jgi:glutaredoxin-related protein
MLCRTPRVAQVLINDKYVGGAEEIQELEDDGALDNLLGVDSIL